jgi:hypothetical protein
MLRNGQCTQQFDGAVWMSHASNVGDYESCVTGANFHYRTGKPTQMCTEATQKISSIMTHIEELEFL